MFYQIQKERLLLVKVFDCEKYVKVVVIIELFKFASFSLVVTFQSVFFEIDVVALHFVELELKAVPL